MPQEPTGPAPRGGATRTPISYNWPRGVREVRGGRAQDGHGAVHAADRAGRGALDVVVEHQVRVAVALQQGRCMRHVEVLRPVPSRTSRRSARQCGLELTTIAARSFCKGCIINAKQDLGFQCKQDSGSDEGTEGDGVHWRDQGCTSNCRTVCGKRPKSARTSSSTTCMPTLGPHRAPHAQSVAAPRSARCQAALCVGSMFVEASRPASPGPASVCPRWCSAPRSRRRR